VSECEGGEIFKMVNVDCRMYENMYPEQNDIVMAQVTDIGDMGAYVKLLEYNNCQGMIMFSELSRRRIRSVNKLVRVGRQEAVAVVRVDKDKGYIDLSKRRVAAEDMKKMEDKWNKGRTVHSIVRHVAETVGVDMIDLYTRWGWPLYKRYGHAYDAFRQAVTDPDKVLEGLDITEEEREELLRNVTRKLTAQAIKFRADFEIICRSFEGIDAIKAALSKAEESSPKSSPVKVKIVAAPLYIMNTTSLQKAHGIEVLNDALEVVKSEITARGGKYVLKKEPRTVSEKDENHLSRLMRDAEAENDEDNDDDEDEDDSENEDKIGANGAGNAGDDDDDDDEDEDE